MLTSPRFVPFVVNLVEFESNLTSLHWAYQGQGCLTNIDETIKFFITNALIARAKSQSLVLVLNRNVLALNLKLAGYVIVIDQKTF